MRDVMWLDSGDAKTLKKTGQALREEAPEVRPMTIDSEGSVVYGDDEHTNTEHSQSVRGSSSPPAVGRDDPAAPRSKKRKDTDPVQEEEAGANSSPQHQHRHREENDEARHTQLKAEARAYAFSDTSTATTASGGPGRASASGPASGRASVPPTTFSTGEGRIAFSNALTNSRSPPAVAAATAAAVAVPTPLSTSTSTSPRVFRFT